MLVACASTEQNTKEERDAECVKNEPKILFSRPQKPGQNLFAAVWRGRRRSTHTGQERTNHGKRNRMEPLCARKHLSKYVPWELGTCARPNNSKKNKHTPNTKMQQLIRIFH